MTDYLLMGFFSVAVLAPAAQTRRGRGRPARQGDRVVFGRFSGVVDAVSKADGCMQLRVDLGGGKVGTQVLGWPAPTPAWPREWDLCPESPPRAGAPLGNSSGGRSERAPAPAQLHSARRDPRLGSRGPPPLPSMGRQAARPTPPRPTSPFSPPPGGSASRRGSAAEQQREQQRQDQQVRRGGRESREDREAHKASRKRSRSEQSGADAADVAVMQHKCSKYRTKLNAASSSPDADSGGGEALTPQKRKDYEEKLQHWENKLRKLRGKDRDRNRDRDRGRDSDRSTKKPAAVQ